MDCARTLLVLVAITKGIFMFRLDQFHTREAWQWKKIPQAARVLRTTSVTWNTWRSYSHFRSRVVATSLYTSPRPWERGRRYWANEEWTTLPKDLRTGFSCPRIRGRKIQGENGGWKSRMLVSGCTGPRNKTCTYSIFSFCSTKRLSVKSRIALGSGGATPKNIFERPIKVWYQISQFTSIQGLKLKSLE